VGTLACLGIFRCGCTAVLVVWRTEKEEAPELKDFQLMAMARQIAEISAS
jgi:hypothetical protein